MANAYLRSLLGESEEILLITRQHWFVMVGAILLEVMLTGAILFGSILLAPFLPLAWIGMVLALVPIGFGAVDFLGWWNRQYVVTSRRVIQISGVVNKNVIDSSLEKVNDVKMDQSFFGRLFDYGDVEILTASELGANLFQRIENPIRFKTAMLNAKEKLAREDEGLPTGAQREDIPGLIAKLDVLRQQGALSEEEFQRKKSELLAKL
ncbi:MAG: PH domain-containing protein [Chloroflexota bacterium]